MDVGTEVRDVLLVSIDQDCATDQVGIEGKVLYTASKKKQSLIILQSTNLVLWMMRRFRPDC